MVDVAKKMESEETPSQIHLCTKPPPSQVGYYY